MFLCLFHIICQQVLVILCRLQVTKQYTILTLDVIDLIFVRGVGVHHDVTFNFGSAKVCSPTIFETSFSYDKDIWIAATDYYMHFYIIVMLFPIITILQLINFTAS